MIFYFTGTGNSLYAAKHFDKELYFVFIRSVITLILNHIRSF